MRRACKCPLLILSPGMEDTSTSLSFLGVGLGVGAGAGFLRGTTKPID
jgi:hypothetical protein